MSTVRRLARCSLALALVALAALLLASAPTPAEAWPAARSNKRRNTTKQARLQRRFNRVEKAFVPLVAISNTVGGSTNFTIGKQQHQILSGILGHGYTTTTSGGPRNNTTLIIKSADGRRSMTFERSKPSFVVKEKSAKGITKTTRYAFGHAKPNVWATTPKRTMLLDVLHSYLQPSKDQQLVVTLRRNNPRPGVYDPKRVERTAIIMPLKNEPARIDHGARRR